LNKQITKDLDEFEVNIDKLFLNANGGNKASKQQVLTVLRALYPTISQNIVDDMFEK